VHLRNERRDKTVHIETVLLHLVRDVRSRRLVLVDGEREVTSVHRRVADCLTFVVVQSFHLTDRRNVDSVTVREVGDHINVLRGEELVEEHFLDLR
jgi:hypothetical protein